MELIEVVVIFVIGVWGFGLLLDGLGYAIGAVADWSPQGGSE